MRDNKKFLEGLQELGIVLNDNQLEQFEKYYDLLIEWNRVMNLTAITEYDEVIVKHFLDSLSLVKCSEYLDIKDTSKKIKVLDMGTGAGFPGVPLKIAFPHLNVLLVDSLNKRINFLNEVIKTLELSDIEAIHARAEELGQKQEYRESYDLCVSRAVAKLYLLSEYCLPFVKKNGYFIPYKSGSIDEEISEAEYALGRLGARMENAISFVLPCSDMERQLVVIKKCHTTEKQYPRNSAKISKNPLIKK